MIINKVEHDIENIIENDNLEKKFLKERTNGFLLSDEQIEILKMYNIDYNNYSNISELIYLIESYLNDGNQDDDLEWLSRELSERNYYQNTDK